MSRDPRIEPQAGDVVTSGKHTHYVVSASDTEVLYTQDHPPVPVDTVTLDEWRRSAKSDVVVAIAGKPLS